MAANKIKRVCITGWDGFIGSNLIRQINDSQIAELIKFEGDLLDPSEIKDFFFKNKNIDQIVHLVGSFGNDADILVKLNLNCLTNLLDEAVKNGVKKIIFTSTGAVYGEPIHSESKEDDDLCPNTFYGVVKKWAEEAIIFYGQNHNMSFVILRYPNVYGPGNTKGVIYNFIQSIKENKEITIYGDGEQTRDFLHVKDACQAIIKAIDYDKSNIFNISTGTRKSLKDITNLLTAKGFSFSIKYMPPNNELKDLHLSIAKAKDELGFEASEKELVI